MPKERRQLQTVADPAWSGSRNAGRPPIVRWGVWQLPGSILMLVVEADELGTAKPCPATVSQDVLDGFRSGSAKCCDRSGRQLWGWAAQLLQT
mmetsp:Transcript_89739/g.196509  ORF Transcript_89739/g.196509 Transcript_89739/m.196509 type:complete len:93 (-) Transcript_89739:48-326(-)